ncbi:MAG: phosphatidylglycerophosphatase A [Spirochaetia bacterium]|nr:phosphatidylglycerophosphatase A [Spirochaetia bacterium]
MAQSRSDFFAVFLATGFYSGYSPFAPGTAGTFVAVLIMVGVSLLLPAAAVVPVFVALAIVTSLAGIPIATRAEKVFGKKDAGAIVIDEFAGTFITLAAFPFAWRRDEIILYTLGFFVFRGLDVLKPFGIASLQRIKGGLGVMIDDIAAGILGLGLLLGFKFFILPRLPF